MVYTAHHDCSVTKIQCIPLVYLQHHRHMSLKTTNFVSLHKYLQNFKIWTLRQQGLLTPQNITTGSRLDYVCLIINPTRCMSSLEVACLQCLRVLIAHYNLRQTSPNSTVSQFVFSHVYDVGWICTLPHTDVLLHCDLCFCGHKGARCSGHSKVLALFLHYPALRWTAR
jgi:hypothetical protein